MRCLALLFFCKFFSVGAFALGPDSQAWLRLGYWEGAKSVARGPDFFISPDGSRDAQKEWEATRAAFLSGDWSDNDPKCRFPARYFLLAKDLLLDPREPWRRCAAFSRWSQQINAQKAYLVFASAFINSPSSMYGHTMLRIGRGGKTEGQALLDNVVSFAANPGEVTGPLYLLYGVAGGFAGVFTVAPFYLKIHEYSHLENRDLWEYELLLNADELSFLVAHVWELRLADFGYYFFKRNCSYYLLRLLEAVWPEKNIADFVFWTIPMDTIKVLQQEGLLGEGQLRPSRWTRATARRALLGSTWEKDAAKDLADGKKISLSQFSVDRQARILDASYEYFRYKNSITNTLKTEQKQIETQLLKQRVDLKEEAPELDFSSLARPDEGHGSQRLNFSLGLSRPKEHFLEVRYRGAYHDLLQKSDGYDPNGELIMGDFRLRAEEKSKDIFVERFDLLRLRSFTPWDSWSKKISWDLSIGHARAKDFRSRCSSWSCSVFELRGAGGVTLPFTSSSSLTVLAQAAHQSGHVLERGFRLGAGPAAFLRFQEWGIKLHLGASRMHSLWGDRSPWPGIQVKFTAPLSARNEWTLEWESLRGYQEGQFVYGRNF